MSRDEAEYIKTALHPSNLPGTRKGYVSEKILDGVRSIVSPPVSAALLAVSQLVTARARAESVLVVVTPPERLSRNDLRTQKLQQSKKPLQEFLSLPSRQQNGSMQTFVQQKGEIQMLARKANRQTAVSDAAA
jgi:hypothetical protein